MDWGADRCPGCDLSLSGLDAELGAEEVVAAALTDQAHVFRAPEKALLERRLAAFHRRLPQVLGVVWTGRFDGPEALRPFGFWLLNRLAVPDGDPLRPNENGVLVLFDAASGAVSLTLGYAMEAWLPPAACAAALGRGRASFRRGRTAAALVAVLDGIESALVRRGAEAAVLPAPDPLAGVPRLRAGVGSPERHRKQPGDAS